MTTVDEIMSDPGWRRRHSVYLLWAIPLLGFVGLLYTGFRARRRDWIAWGVFFAVVVLGATALAPEDDNSTQSLLLGFVLIVAWIASSVLLVAYRKDWLLWKARREGAPASVTHPEPPAPGTDKQGTWVPPPPPRPPGARAGGTRRRLVLLGASVAVILAIGVFAVVSDVVFTNDLLHAEFENGSEPFETGETRDYVIDLAEGTYRIRSRAGHQGAAQSFAPFPRRAYAVDMSTQVASVSGDSVFGVACWHNRAGEGYALIVHPETGVALVKRDDRIGPEGPGILLAANEDAAVPTEDVHLLLSCGNSPIGSSVTLTGYVNGEQVVEATDSDGYDGFIAGALMFQSETPGGEIRFRRADAIVTGSDE